MMKPALFLASLLALSAPVHAQQAHEDVPTFDVFGRCWGSHINENPGWKIVIGGCVRDQQVAYDYLKSVWPDLPSAEKVRCGDVALKSLDYPVTLDCAMGALNRQAARINEPPFRY